jgi:hypothetical protein
VGSFVKKLSSKTQEHTNTAPKFLLHNNRGGAKKWTSKNKSKQKQKQKRVVQSKLEEEFFFG